MARMWTHPAIQNPCRSTIVILSWNSSAILAPDVMSSGCGPTAAFVSPFRDGDRAVTPSCLPSSSAPGLSVSGPKRRKAPRSGHIQRRGCRRSYAGRPARELPAQLFRLAEHHGVHVSRVSVRNQRSRWGSCSPSGHICLNWRLVLMPEAVRDYVLIHELMHLRRLDHSRHFWRLVAHACPDYQNARTVAAREQTPARQHHLTHQPGPILDSLNPPNQRPMVGSVRLFQLPVARALMLRRRERTCSRGREDRGPGDRSRAALPGTAARESAPRARPVRATY